MNGELLVKKLSERIGELEVENIMLVMQLEEALKELDELKKDKKDIAK